MRMHAVPGEFSTHTTLPSSSLLSSLMCHSQLVIVGIADFSNTLPERSLGPVWPPGLEPHEL